MLGFSELERILLYYIASLQMIWRYSPTPPPVPEKEAKF